jgi:hypothetical protein
MAWGSLWSAVENQTGAWLQPGRDRKAVLRSDYLGNAQLARIKIVTEIRRSPLGRPCLEEQRGSEQLNCQRDGRMDYGNGNGLFNLPSLEATEKLTTVPFDRRLR